MYNETQLNMLNLESDLSHTIKEFHYSWVLRAGLMGQTQNLRPNSILRSQPTLEYLNNLDFALIIKATQDPTGRIVWHCIQFIAYFNWHNYTLISNSTHQFDSSCRHYSKTIYSSKSKHIFVYWVLDRQLKSCEFCFVTFA